MARNIINRFLDYKIVGTYLEYDRKTGHYNRKYIKRWRLKNGFIQKKR